MPPTAAYITNFCTFSTVFSVWRGERGWEGIEAEVGRQLQGGGWQRVELQGGGKAAAERGGGAEGETAWKGEAEGGAAGRGWKQRVELQEGVGPERSMV